MEVPPFAKVISVIVVEHNRGAGIAPDPVRRVFTYFDLDGAQLAEHDTAPSNQLDAAWQAAEEALPQGPAQPLWKYGKWRIELHGPWDIEHDGHRPTYQAWAHPHNATGEGDNTDMEGLGPTPAEALLDLARRVRARS